MGRSTAVHTQRTALADVRFASAGVAILAMQLVGTVGVFQTHITPFGIPAIGTQNTLLAECVSFQETNSAAFAMVFGTVGV